MQHEGRRRARWTLMAGALVALTTACRDLPHTPGSGVVVIEQGRLAEVNPADVAVAPLHLGPGIRAPTERLRSAIARGLPSRQYTPLALDFVDSRVLEASYSYGALGEEAVCQVTVHRWDERFWDTGQAIEVDIEMSMFDPGQPEGPALWTGRLTRTIDVTDMVRSTVEEQLYQRALERIAKELLAALPERDTRASRG
jgi:hypothetical protein